MSIDWEKQEWLNFVQQFYDEVGQWLKPYVDQKKLEYDYFSFPNSVWETK